MNLLKSTVIFFVLGSQLLGIELSHLDHYYRKAMSEWKVPGFAIAIVLENEVLLAKGYGVRELGRSEPVTENTLFAIASNTKAFTSAAVAVLAHQKALGWEDHVQQHLPWFQIFQDPWMSHDVRIDDLLSHRIGFRTYSGDLIWWNTPYSAEEVVKRARFLKPQFGFRRGYGYSNIMYIAAGEVVKAASGQSWDQFVRQTLLLPLGMTNTALFVSELKSRPDVATPHALDEEGEPYKIQWQAWDSSAAAGGVISSAADLSLWLRLQLGEGRLDGHTYWEKEHTWKMWSLHTPVPLRADSYEKTPELSLNGAALGWFVADYRGELIVRHGGAYDGMFSHTVLAPRKKLGIVVLSNSMTPLPHSLAFYTLDRFLGAEIKDWSGERLARAKREKRNKNKIKEDEIIKRLPNTTPSLPLEHYTGKFGGPMYGDAQIELRNGKLFLQLLPNPQLEAELKHWHHDVFEVRWLHKFPWFGNGKLQFLLNQKSEIVEFRMDVPNEDFWFDELEFKRR